MLALLLMSPPTVGLDEILSNPKLDGAIVAATVCELDGTKVFEKNSNLHVVPASNQKLLSNAFALYVLGAGFRPTTSFWKMPSKTVVETSGDPLLSYDQIVDVRARLRLDLRLPVEVKEPYAPGIPSTWEFDDLPNKYAAPITALTVDRGSFELWKKGSRIVAVPHGHGVRINATQSGGALKITYDPIHRVIDVQGKWPEKDERIETLSIWEPDKGVAALLGSRFQRVDKTPTSIPDFTVIGKPMSDMLPLCLQPSDNNIAEQFLLMGARAQGELGEDPYTIALERLTKFLTRIVGVAPGEVKPYDGSGMSRHNYVTTRALARLLQWCNMQPTADVWRASLAASGKGTLANRLKEVTFQGKTGTLDMVSALSGYVKHKSGQDLIVSVVLNQYGCAPKDARDILDAFVRQVAAVDLPATEGDYGTN